MTTRYAVPLDDLKATWGTPCGAALVEAAVEGQDPEDADVVEVEGIESLVLEGTSPRGVALVAGLCRASLPGPAGRPVRVFAHGPCGWLPVARPPEVPALPDDSPEFADPPDEEEAA